MLKYAKPVRGKPDNPIATMLALIQLIVMLVGIIGLGVHFFAEKGWLKRFLDGLFSADTGTIAVTVLPILAAGYLLHRWMTSKSEGIQKTVGDIMMYLMMLAGAFFIYKVMADGTF
jgi:hypothetical protein